MDVREGRARSGFVLFLCLVCDRCLGRSWFVKCHGAFEIAVKLLLGSWEGCLEEKSSLESKPT